MSSLVIFERYQKYDQQVIPTLCGLIVTEALLLDKLKRSYPDTPWTSSLLTQVLSAGKKQGRYLIMSIAPVRWQVNSNMVFVFAPNVAYQNLCNQIRKTSTCTAAPII